MRERREMERVMEGERGGERVEKRETKTTREIRESSGSERGIGKREGRV